MSVIAKPRIGKPRPGIRSKGYRIRRKKKKIYSRLKEPEISKVLWCVAVSTAFVLVNDFNGAVTINKHTARCDYITVY